MPSDSLPRKLAAILYADVAAYSRLTGEDEDGTHRQLSQFLDLISSKVEAYQRRVVHYAGDAVLADFASVMTAIDCAVDIQEQLAERGSAAASAASQRARTDVGGSSCPTCSMRMARRHHRLGRGPRRGPLTYSRLCQSSRCAMPDWI